MTLELTETEGCYDASCNARVSIAYLITMDTHTLPPTIEGILEQCPRFRILLVGKSGVGKSSLINHAFNVDIATVSQEEHGVCDINTEITSPQNERFVLHDSQGFEPGEIANLENVKSFIQSRGRDVALKDRVHTVWLCVQVPFAGGRVFETGDEELLEFASASEVPIVVVFTQFDLLVSRTEERLLKEGKSDEDAESLCKPEADVEFRKLCKDPLEKITHKFKLPWVSTSVRKRYRSTLTELIEVTQSQVAHYIKQDVWIVSAMAQRSSALAKIKSSIDVGMKQYWKGLASSAKFSGSTLEQCLATIHVDITSSWNFNDPDDLLNGEDFQKKIKTLVQLVTPEPSKLGPWFGDLNHLQNLIGVVSTLVSAAAPVIAAIGVSSMFISFISNIYQKTPEVLRCLMGYIVDLTLVMDQLFLDTLPITPPRRLTADQVEMALENYETSEAARVHQAVREYANRATWEKILQANNAQEKVIEFINQHRGGT